MVYVARPCKPFARERVYVAEQILDLSTATDRVFMCGRLREKKKKKKVAGNPSSKGPGIILQENKPPVVQKPPGLQ